MPAHECWKTVNTRAYLTGARASTRAPVSAPRNKQTRLNGMCIVNGFCLFHHESCLKGRQIMNHKGHSP